MALTVKLNLYTDTDKQCGTEAYHIMHLVYPRAQIQPACTSTDTTGATHTSPFSEVVLLIQLIESWFQRGTHQNEMKTISISPY